MRTKAKQVLKLHEKIISIGKVASLVGLLIANNSGCKWGKLHYRDLERDKTHALKNGPGDYESFMSLSIGLPSITLSGGLVMK